MKKLVIHIKDCKKTIELTLPRAIDEFIDFYIKANSEDTFVIHYENHSLTVKEKNISHYEIFGQELT